MTKRKKAGAHPASNARGKARAEHKQEGDLKPARMSGYGMLGELDRYLYGEGRHYRIYEKLGAHPLTYHGQAGYYFAVWAPHAASVSVVGDFNGWNPDLNPMTQAEDSGIYEDRKSVV